MSAERILAWLVAAFITLQGIATIWMALSRETIPEWLSKQWWLRMTTTTLFGWLSLLVGVGILLLLAFGPRLRSTPTLAEPTTPENVEARARVWADNFGLGIRRVDAKDVENFKDAHFAIILTLRSGRNIVVTRFRDRERYLSIQSALTLSPTHRTIYDSITPEKQEIVAEKLRLSLTSAGHDFVIDGTLQNVIVLRRIPITADLTEHQFMAAVDTVAIGSILMRDALVLALREAQAPPTP